MRIFILTLLLFLGSFFTAVASESELNEADRLRLANPQKSRQLLDDIDFDSLTQHQKYRYRYLRIYLSTIFDGDFAKVIERYRQLIAELPDNTLKVRAMQSTLTLMVFKAQWFKSFALVSELKTLMSQIDAYTVEPDSYLSLINFYRETEQPDIALNYATKAYKHPAATPHHQCHALSLKNQILYEGADPELSEDDFYKGISLCEAVPVPFFVAHNYTSLFKFLTEKGEVVKAEIVGEEAGRRIEKIGWKHFSSSFAIATAELRMAQENFAEAKQLSQQVISEDIKQDNREAVLDAYANLATIAAKEKNFEKAYEYEKQHNALTRTFHDARVAKSLAIQQARFNLENKESRIALLDKKNQLLSTESRLVREQMANMTLVVAVALAGVLGLLFWSYRSAKTQKKLEELASTDYLTGISNRGFFNKQCQDVVDRAQEKSIPVSLIFLDLDHFKKINDAFGHQTGDWVLIEVTKRLSTLCADQKYKIGRLGGEEFGIVMAYKDSVQALDFAQECRKSIEAMDTIETGSRFEVTASFGISDTRQAGYNVNNLFSASDLALYQAKKFGRNQVLCYDGNMSDE